MNKFPLLIALSLATIPVAAARAQTTISAPDEAATARAQREIADATRQLVAALKRADAEGALRWLAPDFRNETKIRFQPGLKCAL